MHPVMQRHRRLLAALLFVVVLLVLGQLLGLRQHVSLSYLHAQLEANRVSGVLLFILLFTLGNLIQIPGWIFLAAAVLALGRSWGAVVTYAAASLSCTCTFLTLRAIGGNALHHLKNRRAMRLLQQLEAHPVRSVVLLRTLFQTLPALNYALALSGLRFRHYLIGTLLGLPLPIAAYCLFFDRIEQWLLVPALHA